MKKSLLDRFWKKVDITDGCWEWKGYKNHNGYGSISSGNGKQLRVHRFSWEIHNHTEIPIGLLVCHTCDNPKCVNPYHLFLGTPQQNVDDMIAKGRMSKTIKTSSGTRKRYKISEYDVKQIRSVYSKGSNNGITMSILANQYGIHHSHVSKIIRNLRWKTDFT